MILNQNRDYVVLAGGAEPCLSALVTVEMTYSHLGKKQGLWTVFKQKTVVILPVLWISEMRIPQTQVISLFLTFHQQSIPNEPLIQLCAVE